MADSDKKQAEDERVDKLSIRLAELGLRELATKVSDERFERRVLEARTYLDHLELQEYLDDRRMDRVWESIASIQSKAFDQASRYNNLIITFGYAGFFAIWGFVNDQLKIFDRLFVAALLGISLLLFIGWTLSSSLLIASYMRKTAAVHEVPDISPAERLEMLSKVEAEIAKKKIRHLSYHPFVFYLTAFLGVGGGIVLLVAVTAKIFGFNFDLESVFQWIERLLI